MTRAPAFAAALQSYMAARDTTAVTIPVIQPAAPFLDMAGEDLRRRIFLTESETGETLCLRPEFTIPVCLGHIADRAETPARYAYVGEVFRQRRNAGSEFYQAGIEDLGDPDIATTDARSLAEAVDMVRLAAPKAEVRGRLEGARPAAWLAHAPWPHVWQRGAFAGNAGSPFRRAPAAGFAAGSGKTGRQG
jgi:ATP phosphoribosyltransferase regulatory subunit